MGNSAYSKLVKLQEPQQENFSISTDEEYETMPDEWKNEISQLLDKIE